MADHHKLGTTGEVIAADYLQKEGFRILAKNFRYKKAEIDLIAQKDKLLIFVEIKTRSSDKFGFPEEFVSNRKIELFLMAAEEFILQKDWMHDIRFDIISISASGNGNFNIHHIEDAFH